MLVQIEPPLSAAPADRRADRDARTGRRCRHPAPRHVGGRTLRDRHRARVAQPSLASRSVRRCGDRRRRDRARRAVHGRGGDRDRRPVAVRAARRPALPLRRAERRRRHRRLRQRDRRAEPRRRRLRRRVVRRQRAGQRRRAGPGERTRDHPLVRAARARSATTSCWSAKRPIAAASAAPRSPRSRSTTPMPKRTRARCKSPIRFSRT